ncbi:MAG: succinate dehydrogenase, hydrophobic membrane anchor protein [Alphaproteobacteria bacterium]|nr:succinate dehydrogenase, hydrophobic membrane anchor protein [Alphaproteobacteria bacterium]
MIHKFPFIVIVGKFMLKAVKGLKLHPEADEDWAFQKISSLAMLFLIPWLYIYGLGDAGGRNYEQLVIWLQNPFNKGFLILTIIFMMSHARLGLENIIEDYIHHKLLFPIALYSVKLGCKFFMIAAIIGVFVGGNGG